MRKNYRCHGYCIYGLCEAPKHIQNWHKIKGLPNRICSDLALWFDWLRGYSIQFGNKLYKRGYYWGKPVD